MLRGAAIVAAGLLVIACDGPKPPKTDESVRRAETAMQESMGRVGSQDRAAPIHTAVRPQLTAVWRLR